MERLDCVVIGADVSGPGRGAGLGFALLRWCKRDLNAFGHIAPGSHRGNMHCCKNKSNKINSPMPALLEGAGS